MNPQDKNKLENIIAKRKENMSSIIHFEDMFLRFARLTLRQCVEEINILLHNDTNDIIKILYDDPFEPVKSSYFVQLKLYVNLNNNFINSNYSIAYKNAEPTLRFNGQPSDGMVVISQKIADASHYTVVKSVKAAELSSDFASATIIDFIDKAYK